MSMTNKPIDRRIFLLGTGAAFVLSGCSIGDELGQVIGPPDAPQIYMLEPAVTPAAAGPRVPWQLSITVPDAPASIDTVRIALKPTPLTLDFYADAAWQDRTPLLIQGLLVEAFERTGRVAVARDTDGLLSDYVLRTEIRAFEANYPNGLSTVPEQPTSPPQISVRLEARLIAVPNREIAGHVSVVKTANAANNGMEAIVSAFNEALSAALSEIVTWTMATPQAA